MISNGFIIQLHLLLPLEMLGEVPQKGGGAGVWPVDSLERVMNVCRSLLMTLVLIFHPCFRFVQRNGFDVGVEHFQFSVQCLVS